MTTAVLYALLCAAAYYLGSRALITQWAWSRYPPWLDRFMLCAACTGFWYGLGCGFLGRALGLSLFGIDPASWYAPPITALCGIAWTPMASAVHIAALESLDTAPEE